jgi:hypothetical protein
MNGCELQMSPTKFVKYLIAQEAEMENTASSNVHQTPDLYFNYKSFHSMKLLGVVDANCCFTLIDVGAHGREKGKCF